MKKHLSLRGEGVLPGISSAGSALDGLPLIFKEGSSTRRDLITTREDLPAATRSMTTAQFLSSFSNFGDLVLGSGIVSRTEAWRNPHVRACVEANSQAIASLPFSVYKGDARQKKHWFLDLVDHPNEFAQLTQHDLKVQTVAVRELFGESFWFLDREDSPTLSGKKAPVAAIWIYHPHAVTEAIDQRTHLQNGWIFQWEGDRFFVDREDAIQFKRYDPMKHNPRRPSRGSSPLDAAMLAVSTHLAADKFNLGFFSNGYAPGIVVTSKDEMMPGGAEMLRDKLRAQSAGRKDDLIVLDGGEAEIHQLSVSQKDSEFIAGKKMAMAEICEVFKTPPAVVGNQDQKYDNAEMQMLIWWDIPLASIQTNLCDAITLALLRKEGMKCFLETSGVEALQGRRQKRVELYTKLVDTRHSPKVAAQIAGIDVDPSMPGHDQVFVSFAHIPIEYALEGSSVSISKEGAPEAAPVEPVTPAPAEPARMIRLLVDDDSPVVRIAERAATKNSDLLEIILEIVEKDAKKLRDKAKPFQLQSIKIGTEQIGNALGTQQILAIDNPRVVAFLEQRGNLITSVPETMAIRITNKARALIEKGTSPEDIGTILRKDFNDITSYQARQIGRQEVGSGLNGGRHMQMEEEGVDAREWLSSKDNRVRDTPEASHVEMDGEIVDGIDTRYSNGLRYPQDPEGSNAEVQGCRCIELPSIGGARSLRCKARLRALASREIAAAAANDEQIDQRTGYWRAVVKAKDIRRVERQMTDMVATVIHGWRAPILKALADMGIVT